MGRQGSEPVRLRLAPQPELVPTERNIEESYLFAGGANRENEIREYVVDATLEDGRKAQRRFRYTPSKEYGDTTDFDRDVYRAIILHAFQNGGMPPDGIVYFSLYQLRKILDLPEKGDSYRKIRESIVKLQTMSVNADTYWQELKGFKSEYYSTFNRVNFEANEDRYGRASEHHWVRFDEVIVRSYHEGYVRDLDHNFYFSLNKKHSRALYSEIDLGRGKGLVWELPLSDLSLRLGMAASYRSPSAKKRALAAAHEEMKRKGFLAGVSFPEKGTVLCNYYLRALPYQKWVRSPGGFLYKYISEEKPLDVEPPQRFLEEANVVPDYGDLAPAVAGAAGAAATVAVAAEKPDAPSPVWEPDQPTRAAAEELWRRTLGALEGEIDTSSLRVWFDGCRAISLVDGELTIVAPNSFAKEYIESRFGDLLSRALAELCGDGCALAVAVGRVGEN